MQADHIEMIIHLGGALLAGGAIGLERSFHGRPAGFRTHALVCVASSLLMMVTFFQSRWMPADVVNETVRADPTRMAQGIMTGIGFLGAGVIFKEGFSVRGLTTAASIWITAAIGILIGVGFYFPALLATLATLGILSVFRHIEAVMPGQCYVHHNITFARDRIIPEAELRNLLQQQGFAIANTSYRLLEDDRFQYRMVIRTGRIDNVARLTELWRQNPEVLEFCISPTGD